MGACVSHRSGLLTTHMQFCSVDAWPSNTRAVKGLNKVYICYWGRESEPLASWPSISFIILYQLTWDVKKLLCFLTRAGG